MSDLYSIAYSSSHSSSPAWELQNLGVFNADTSELMMEKNTPPFFSPLEADFSTGYLEDALFEFSSKRRRLLLFDEEHTKDCYNSAENSFSQISKCDTDSSINSGMSRSVSINVSEDASLFTDMKASQEAISAFQTSSISSDKQSLYSINPMFSSGKFDSSLVSSLFDVGCYPSNVKDVNLGEKRSKKRVIEDRVVYPFGFVKPGGFDGDVTLHDINERILMPPSRPIRHPVGDFACRPLVSSADASGLSGKAVMALTRIHTQGRGTITIIRTRG